MDGSETLEEADFVNILKGRGLRPRTLKNYTNLMQRYGLFGLNIPQINDFLTNRTDTAQSTRCIISSATRSYFRAKYALKKDEVKVRYIFFKSKERDIYYEHGLVQRAIDACKDPELNLFLTIIMETGLRKSIALNMTPDMVDFKTGKIKVPTDIEGNKLAIKFSVWLTPKTAGRLGRYVEQLRVTKGRRIFRFSWAKRVEDINYRIKLAAKNAGIIDWQHFGAHAIRHSFATDYRAIYRGDMDALKFMLGHKDIKTTERYAKHRDEQLAEADIKRIRGENGGKDN